MPSRRISILREDSGFTILEIAVTLAIFMFVASIGLFASMDFYRGYSFNTSVSTAISLLERARSRSMDNIGGASSGLHIVSTGYTLFRGTAYGVPNHNYDEFTPLDKGITVSGLTDIIFSQLSGRPNATVTIILSNGVKSKTISINREGGI